MKVAVIGLGKIGASLCADLKERGIASEITGVDSNPDSVANCISKGLIDIGLNDPSGVRSGVDVCVLAVPVGSMEAVARAFFAVARPGVVVTDVASVKVPVCELMSRILPEGVGFVPAHPIAGDEKHGARSYKTGIFDGNPLIITGGDDKSSGKVKDMWRKTGANIFGMSPEEHDRVFAFISHLPHVCAYSLASVAASACSGSADALSLSGGGLRDTTRIAMSDPAMWAEILIRNSSPVLEALESFSESVAETAAAVKSRDTEKLTKILERGRSGKALFSK